MLSFSIPVKSGDTKKFFDFTVESRVLLFAGSRYLSVNNQTSSDLINAFGSIGFSFLIGCATGVDESFRRALSCSDYKDRTIVALAFPQRVNRCYGLNSMVVSRGMPPKIALAKRTIWMSSYCSLLILFPSDPIGKPQPLLSKELGKGSALAFNNAIKNNKPVFVVSGSSPKESDLYTVLPSNLFGVIDGYWCIPNVYKNTGLCNETPYNPTAII